MHGSKVKPLGESVMAKSLSVHANAPFERQTQRISRSTLLTSTLTV